MIHQECEYIILVAVIGYNIMDTGCSLKIGSAALVYKTTTYKFQHSHLSCQIIMLLIDKYKQIVAQSKYLLLTIIKRATGLGLLEGCDFYIRVDCW